MAEISHDKSGIRRRREPRWRVTGYVAAGAALLVITGLWLFRGPLFHRNFHTVIPNEVYRSAQLSPEALERRIKELSLRSVINLRTSERKASWFKTEHEVTEVHGVDLHMVRLSVFMPPRGTLQELVRLLNTAKRPLLLHCEMGVERSGLASAVAVLLSGGNIAEARRQFSLTYGFVPLICHPDLLKVLDDYGHWLAVRRWAHTPERFRRWVEDDYVPYFYRARLEPLDVPASIVKGSGVLMRFRATNTSPQPWRFRSDHDSGVHLGAKVRLFEPSVNPVRNSSRYDSKPSGALNPAGIILKSNPAAEQRGIISNGVKQEFELRGGFRNLTVAPGESVVLEIGIPATLESGRYKFLVDLVDERVKWFSDMGSEPITFDFRVEDSDTLAGIHRKERP